MNFEECDINKATCFKFKNKIYSVPDEAYIKHYEEYIGLRIEFDRWISVSTKDLELFDIIPGIKVAPKPIEFEAVLIDIGVEYDNERYVLLADEMKFISSNLNKKFRCVEIL